MILEYELTAEDVRQTVLNTLQKHLSLETEGYSCTTEMTLNVLLKAAVDRSSLEAACADLEQVASSNRLREQLNDALDVADLRQHECELNAALASTIPVQLKRSGLDIAMDWHDEPFYGKTPELRTYVCRSQAKQGTTRFFRIATAYLMWRDVRLTLAMTYVLPEHSTLDVVQRLLQRLTRLGFSQTTLFLDKGFCCGEVIRYLQARRQPAILACAIRGKTGGTRALCTGRRSYRTTYTFTDGTVADVAMVATLPRGRDGRRRRKWLMFVLVELDWAPPVCKSRYRRRFGIECSYRQGRQVRISTTSMNPALRFFCLGLALVLVNVWIALRWAFARQPGRGPWRVDPERFRFHRFIHFLMRAIEHAFGVVMSIPTHRSPQFVIY
jgi:putative transposase